MALAHIISNREKLLNSCESQGWLSFGAGASVAYVFVPIFPEIGIFQQQLIGHGHSERFLSQPLYLAALSGLCFLYMLDTIETGYEDASSQSSRKHKYFMPLFLCRTILYVTYNIMIAYVITQRPGQGLINISLISMALMFHFIVINVHAHKKYGDFFNKYMRWSAAGGLAAGWCLGMLADFPDVLIMTAFSLIGGMTTYIALKNELPRTKHRAPYHFATGAVIYALIALAIPYFGYSNINHH